MFWNKDASRYFTTLPIAEVVEGDNFALLENLNPYTDYQVHLTVKNDEESLEWISEELFFSTSGISSQLGQLLVSEEWVCKE